MLEIIRESRSAVPVLLTTGYSPGRFEMGDFSANRVRMVQKPYEPGELFKHVHEMIDEA